MNGRREYLLSELRRLHVENRSKFSNTAYFDLTGERDLSNVSKELYDLWYVEMPEVDKKCGSFQNSGISNYQKKIEMIEKNEDLESILKDEQKINERFKIEFSKL